MSSSEQWGADRVMKLKERMTPPEALEGEDQKKVTEEFFAKLEQEELDNLANCGFSLSKSRIKKLKEYCISTNTSYFIETSIIPEMLRWRKNNETASEEDEASAIKVLLKIVSQDYTYGRVNKQNMPDKKEGERKLREGKITPEEHFRIYRETQESMEKQREEIIKKILGTRESTVSNAAEETNEEIKKVIEREPVYA